jgi:hypothetical protein
MDPYQLAQIYSLLTARKGDNVGLTVSTIAGQQQQAQARAQQMQMQQLQMQQAQRQNAQQQRTDELAQRAFAPGVQPATPSDDEGNPMPRSGGGGMSEYVKGMQQIDPVQAMQLQAQMSQLNAKERVKMAPGETVGSYQDGHFVPDFTAQDKAPPGFKYVNGQLVADPEWLKTQIAIRTAGRPQTNVSVQTGEQPFQKEFGKGQAEAFFKGREKATKAADALTSINNMRESIDSGMFQGGGASTKAALINYLQPMGWSIGAEDAANTAKFNMSAGKFLLDHAKELGANPSNADAKRIEQIIGSSDTNPNAMKDVLDWQEQMSRKVVKGYNTQYEQIKSNPATFNAYDMSIAEPPVYQPKPKAQAPQGPLKKNMTETYRARQAIKAGADERAVRQRMRENGFDDTDL